MSSTIGNSGYGFVPDEKLRTLSFATPEKKFRFLCDSKEISKSVRLCEKESKGRTLQKLNERVFFLAQIALIHGNQYLKTAQWIAKTYKSYFLELKIIVEAEAILSSFNSNWIKEAQETALIYRKSLAFASLLEQSQPTGTDCKLLNNPKLFFKTKFLLNTSKIYKLIERANELYNQWKDVLKFEYGLIEKSKAEHLGILNERNNFIILLNCTVLDAKTEYKAKHLHHISRRIIALSSAYLIKNNEKYLKPAIALIETVKKEDENNEFKFAVAYFKNVKSINISANWVTNCLKLKAFAEANPDIKKKIGKHKLALLENNDLVTVLDKYLFTKEFEYLLQKRTVSFGKVNKEDTDSETSPRDEIQKKLSLIKNEDRLRQWLMQAFPLLYDKYESRELPGNIKQFLAAQNEFVLKLYQQKKIINSHSELSEDFIAYRNFKDNPALVYVCFRHLLSVNSDYLTEFLIDKHYYNLASFLFYEHPSFFNDILKISDSLFDYENRKLVKSDSRLSVNSFLEIKRLNSPRSFNVKKFAHKKRYLYLLHADKHFNDFFINILSTFYESKFCKILLIQILSLFHDSNKNNRNSVFLAIKQLYSVYKGKFNELDLSGLVIDCINYFRVKKMSVLVDYYKEEENISFIDYVIRNHYVNFQLFLAQRIFSVMEDIIPTLNEVKLPPPLLEAFPKIAALSSDSLIRAKQYICLLLTNKKLQFEYVKNYIENIQIIVNDIDEVSIKRLRNKQITIGSELFDILYENWKIELKYYSSDIAYKGDRTNLIEIQSVDQVFKRSNDILMVSKKFGDDIKCKFKNYTDALIKIGTNLFYIKNLEEIFLSSFPNLTIRKSTSPALEEVSFSIQNPNFTPNITDIISQLQDNSLERKEEAVAKLDILKANNENLFKELCLE